MNDRKDRFLYDSKVLVWSNKELLYMEDLKLFLMLFPFYSFIHSFFSSFFPSIPSFFLLPVLPSFILYCFSSILPSFLPSCFFSSLLPIMMSLTFSLFPPRRLRTLIGISRILKKALEWRYGMSLTKE